MHRIEILQISDLNMKNLPQKMHYVDISIASRN